MIFVGTHCVRFDIGLANHIQAVTRAKLIPKRDVWIMTGPNRIDIILFHQFEIMDHRGLTNNVSGFRKELIPIYPLDINRLAVYQKLALADLDLTESNQKRNDFKKPALRAQQRNEKRIKPGRLGRPGEDARKIAVPSPNAFPTGLCADADQMVADSFIRARFKQ